MSPTTAAVALVGAVACCLLVALCWRRASGKH